MLEFVGVSIMIKFKNNIDNICEYQTSILPDKVTIIKTQKSVEEMMKISFPIAIILCLIMFITIFIKTLLAKTVVISPIMLMVGLLIGFSLLIIHEWLHAVIYPKNATVTIGRLKGKLTFVALASYPLKRNRFILMCLFPFLLGIIPLIIFIVSPIELKSINGLMFGMACIGMISPYPDVYNVITVLRVANTDDKIIFFKDDMYKL